MSVFRLGRFFLVTTLAVAAVFANTSAVAQEDEAAQSFDETGPAVTPDAPSAIEQDSLDAYQVRVAETEYMAGRLQVVDPLSGEVRGVRKSGLLIIQGGKVVGRAETGVSGVAQIKSLPIGSYSVVAIGPDGMGAFGFEVLPLASGVTAPSYRFDMLIVPASDMAVAQRAIWGEAAPRAAADAPSAPAPPIPVAFQGQLSPAEGYRDGAVSAPLKGQPILVRDGESGIGQLLVVASRDGKPTGMANARVSFLRGGQVLGSAETDAEGYCGVVGLDDGYYSMIGIGSNGFVAMGVRVETVSGLTTAEVADASERQVSLLQPAPFVEWRVAGANVDAAPFAPGFPFGPEVPFGPGVPLGPEVPFGPGGYAGFGGGGGGFGAGGGGGFGGGGLLGALVGAGVGAAIGAAVADGDEDNRPAIIVSPNTPPAGP